MRAVWKAAVLNRLLKFPRPKPAAGKGYILGRVGRETIESDSIDDNHSDDDLDSVYVDRRPQYDSGKRLWNQLWQIEKSIRLFHSWLICIYFFAACQLDNQSIAIRSGSSSDGSTNEDKAAYDEDQIRARSGDSASKTLYLRQRLNDPSITHDSPNRTNHATNLNMNSSSSITNITKMATRYRFRDLLLGDFSFNDDGER